MADKKKDVGEKAREWFTSKEGKESLKKSVEKAIANIERFKRSRQINPELLRKPFTI
jgi:hypothetical protein